MNIDFIRALTQQISDLVNNRNIHVQASLVTVLLPIAVFVDKLCLRFGVLGQCVRFKTDELMPKRTMTDEDSYKECFQKKKMCWLALVRSWVFVFALVLGR